MAQRKLRMGSDCARDEGKTGRREEDIAAGFAGVQEQGVWRSRKRQLAA